MAAASQNFKVGDLVWAKMKRYPPWPAKIADPPPKMKAPKNKKVHCVYFFGTENFAWIPDDCISPHSESVLNSLSQKKSGAYQNAINALLSCVKSVKKKESPMASNVEEEVKTEQIKTSPVKAKKTHVKVKQERKLLTHKRTYKSLKRSFHDMNGRQSSPEKSPKRRNYVFSSWDKYQEFLSEPKHSKVPPIVTKCVDPSKKKIGFIGLGQLGGQIVRNLIAGGHAITVYSRNLIKCDPYVQMGAEKVQSPAELVVKCDIIFCCVSNPDASKALIFGEKGILKGFEEAERMEESRRVRCKGYVELTSIDPDTSLGINEAIGMKRGRYLEAALCGTVEDARNGDLLVLAAGDRRIFSDCESCFYSMGKHAFYLNCKVGYSAKMAMFLYTFFGTMNAAVAEAMVLAERLNISKEHFLELLRFGPLSCDFVVKQMELMREREFTSIVPIEQLQKDLNKSLILSDNCSQPMPVTAAANEVFKYNLHRLKGHLDNKSDVKSALDNSF